MVKPREGEPLNSCLVRLPDSGESPGFGSMLLPREDDEGASSVGAQDDDHDTKGLARLPEDIVSEVLGLVGTSGRGVLRHVSPTFRQAVDAWQRVETPPSLEEDVDAPNKARPTRSISLSYLCTSVDLLVWSRTQGAPWTDRAWLALACPLAASGGHVASLQYLRKEGCPWGPRTTECAAAHGHLECLEWLRGARCEWDGRTPAAAAAAGNLEVLKYVVSNGCPVDERVCEQAAINKHFDLLQWAVQNGCPCEDGFYERVLGSGLPPDAMGAGAGGSVNNRGRWPPAWLSPVMQAEFWADVATIGLFTCVSLAGGM